MLPYFAGEKFYIIQTPLSQWGSKVVSRFQYEAYEGKNVCYGNRVGRLEVDEFATHIEAYMKDCTPGLGVTSKFATMMQTMAVESRKPVKLVIPVYSPSAWKSVDEYCAHMNALVLWAEKNRIPIQIGDTSF